MEVDLIFKIAGIGILVSVLAQVLGRAGREDIATLTSLAGLVIVLIMVVNLIAGFFQDVKAIFQLYCNGGGEDCCVAGGSIVCLCSPAGEPAGNGGGGVGRGGSGGARSLAG